MRLPQNQCYFNTDVGNRRRLVRRQPSIIISIVTVISFCITTGLVTALVLQLLKHQHEQEKDTSTALQVMSENLRDSVCLKCDVFGLSRDQIWFNKNVWLLPLRDGELCCLANGESLWRLLNLNMIKFMMNQPMNFDGTISPHLPSAHLYLDSLEANDYKWTDEYGFGAAHVIRPIQFRNGSFHISKAGFYNIYSFITLKRRTNSRTPSTIIHSIRRINSQRTPHTTVVLESMAKLPRSSETFTTSYLSGVIQLQTKDELYVDVSDIEALYRYAPSSFFGLHLVKEL